MKMSLATIRGWLERMAIVSPTKEEEWRKLVGRLVTVECIDSMADNQRTEILPEDSTLFERKVHGLLLGVNEYITVVGYESPAESKDTQYDYTTIWTPAVRAINVDSGRKRRG